MATINQIELRVNLRANNNEKSDQFGRLDLSGTWYLSY